MECTSSATFPPVCLGLFLLLLAMGGCKKQSPPLLPPQASTVTPIPDRGEFLSPKSTTTSSHTVNLQVSSFVVPLDLVEATGLQDLLSSTPRTNEALNTRIPEHPLMGLAQVYTNTQIHLESAATYIGKTAGSDAKRLIDVIATDPRFQRINLGQGPIHENREVGFTVENQFSFVLASFTNAGKLTYTTTNLPLGQSARISVHHTDPSVTALSVTAWNENWTGYKSDSTPTPTFDLRFISGQATIEPNEFLVLASERRTNTFISKRPTPFLSALPKVGRFFQNNKLQTNTFHQLILIQRSP